MFKTLLLVSSTLALVVSFFSHKPSAVLNEVVQKKEIPKNYVQNYLPDKFMGKITYPDEITYARTLPIYCSETSSTISFNQATEQISINVSKVSDEVLNSRMQKLFNTVDLSEYPQNVSGYFRECEVQDTDKYFGYVVINKREKGYDDQVISYLASGTRIEKYGIYERYAQAVCYKPLIFSNTDDFYFECAEGDFSNVSLIRAGKSGTSEILNCEKQKGKFLRTTKGIDAFDIKYVCNNGMTYE